MKNLRIVFMGTPEFAVATLGSLLMNGYNVVGVVTAPDKPSGRGQKLSKSAVKEFAELSYLPVLQPVKLKDPEFLRSLRALNADLFIVVAFRMLPEEVWKMPEYGTINLHASLLPHYRGAAPINHAIINGETTTGVTTFFINDKIDTGNILLRQEVRIYQNESAGDLHNRLMKLGARLVIKTLQSMTRKNLFPMPQSQFLKPGETPKEAPKIFPQDCTIDWNKTSVEVHNFIRGLSPVPCAKTVVTDGSAKYILKIFEGRADNKPNFLTPGQIISDGKSFIKVTCGGGSLNILSLQLESKKRMNVSDFLMGFRIAGYKAEVS